MLISSDSEKIVQLYNVLVKFMDALSSIERAEKNEALNVLFQDPNMESVGLFVGFLQGEYSEKLKDCRLPKGGGWPRDWVLCQDHLKTISDTKFSAELMPEYVNESEGASQDEGINFQRMDPRTQQLFLSAKAIEEKTRERDIRLKARWYKVTEENKNKKIPKILKEEFRRRLDIYNVFLIDPPYEMEESELRFDEIAIDILDLFSIKLAYYLISNPEEESIDKNRLIAMPIPRLELFQNLFLYTKTTSHEAVREQLFKLYGAEEDLVDFCNFIADRLKDNYDQLEALRAEYPNAPSNAPRM